MYQFEFNVNPIAKGRPKFARIGKFVRTYTPEKTASAEAELRFLMAQYWNNKNPVECAIEAHLSFYFVRPKSISEKKRPHMITKPDLENCIKLVQDAGNGILWRDDSQIVFLFATKVYALKPKIILSFKEIA